MMKFRVLLWSLAVLITVPAGMGAYHFREKLKDFFEPPAYQAPERKEYVEIGTSQRIRVKDNSKLAEKLELVVAKSETLCAPILQVSGFVVARLTPGLGLPEGRWDFATPELGAMYGDWIKARADVEFNQTQAGRIEKLGEANLEKLTNDVVRITELWKIGSSPKQDLDAAKNELKKAEIQSAKDNYEAQSSIKNAERSKKLLERQLLQNGIDPAAISKAKEGLALVVADVPETRIEKLKVDQSCEARFFSFPNVVFDQGRVGMISPTVSKERRTLRVTFELHDEKSRLIPGLFADIGLGADKNRKVISVPTEAVVHIDRKDYVMLEATTGEYEVHEVVVEEPIVSMLRTGSRIAVSSGLAEGDRVVAAGAILLRPLAVKTLTRE